MSGNKYCVYERGALFHSARWKAYLRNLQNGEEENGEGDNGNHKTIYHIYHSQKIWFTQEKTNGHQKAAREHLKRSDGLMKDCTAKIDALEETLANTPKPSQVLDWNTVW
jgi:hypothetical protein